MEYERIHKLQSGGAFSPSNLRLMLLGAHHHQQQQHQQQRGKEGPNPCYSRTSPPNKTTEEVKELEKDNLLAARASSVRLEGEECRSNSRGKSYKTQEKVLEVMMAQLPAARSADDEDTSECDINRYETTTTCGFEFPRGDRTLPSPSLGPFSRPIPSKWNDAEKWLVKNKQTLIQPHHLRGRPVALNHLNRPVIGNWERVAPESAVHEPRPPAAHVEHNDDCSSHNEVDSFPLAEKSAPTASAAGIPPHPVLIQSVSMRDTGTEMTPIPSQDPSRTATPLEAVTPIRSRSPSRASTPRGQPGREPAAAPPPPTVSAESDDRKNKYLSEEEFRIKTRREIAALGVRLGKMSIAAWASRDDGAESARKPPEDLQQLDMAEFEARAQAWEESEKLRHLARFKREEFKIQIWESHEKARVEAKWRDVEVQADRLRARAQEKMLRNVTATKQKAVARRAGAAEARNIISRRPASSSSLTLGSTPAEGGDRMRRTGRMHSSSFFCCTGCS